jgi:hypothetical protein
MYVMPGFLVVVLVGFRPNLVFSFPERRNFSSGKYGGFLLFLGVAEI